MYHSALERIARANAKGKTNVNLSREEMEALERRRNPQPEPPGLEKLAPRSIDGVYAEGTRTTLVIPAGKEENDREMHVVMERWYSPDLRITLDSNSDDPRLGKMSTVVSELTRSDPSPESFRVPADYRVEEQARQ